LLACILAGALAAQSFDDELRRGLVALSGNDLAQARQSLETASRLQPENAVVWAALAQTYLRAKEADLANEAAGRAARLAPADSPVKHALAMFYSETGDLAKAADAERQYASGKSADREAEARAADLSLRAGEPQQAIQWATAALAKGAAPTLHHLLGEAYAAANQPDAALRELRMAVEGDPKVEEFVFDLGQMQLRAGDFTGALSTFDQGRQRFPASAQIELAFGVAAYGQRRFAGAIDSFLRVVALDPSVEQPYVFLARLLDQAEDRLPRIVAAYAAWEKAEPANPLPPCLYAKALGAAGEDAAKIEAELRRSIGLNERYWESHFELGVLLGKKGDWRTAAVELKRSIELNPKHAPAHFQLARAYDKLGQRELAQTERAEHERLTAAETGVGEKPAPGTTTVREWPEPKGKPTP
jgi:tetratricopeptide (TPR) repeat protein